VLTESRDLCELLSIPTDTGAATKIADVCSPPPTDGSSGSWSPTGAAYAIVRNGRLSVIDPDGRVDMDIDGLTGLGGVAWSPGGIWLGATGTSAYVLRPDGSGLRQLSGNVLSWSPDGQKLAVSGTDGMLLVGPASGVGVRSIGVFPWPSTWSSDGSRFAFLRDGDLWTAAIDGTDVRNITSLPLGGAIAAAWSPDDRWIAVATNHGLLLTHPDGAEARWLELGTDETVWGPRWSPDSTRVAFSTYPEGSASQRAWRTYLVAASGAPTILLEATWDVSWSPDGRFLVGTDSPSSSSGSGQGLVLMNSDGSGRRVLRPEGFGNTPVWVR
jgi:hypothetical protein